MAGEAEISGNLYLVLFLIMHRFFAQVFACCGKTALHLRRSLAYCVRLVGLLISLTRSVW